MPSKVARSSPGHCTIRRADATTSSVQPGWLWCAGAASVIPHEPHPRHWWSMFSFWASVLFDVQAIVSGGRSLIPLMRGDCREPVTGMQIRCEVFILETMVGQVVDCTLPLARQGYLTHLPVWDSLSTAVWFASSSGCTLPDATLLHLCLWWWCVPHDDIVRGTWGTSVP